MDHIVYQICRDKCKSQIFFIKRFLRRRKKFTLFLNDIFIMPALFSNRKDYQYYHVDMKAWKSIERFGVLNKLDLHFDGEENSTNNHKA